MPQDRHGDANELSSESSGENSNRNSFIDIDDETGGVAIGSNIVCRVSEL